MESLPYLLIIAAIVQLFIFFYLIRSATRSNMLVRQNNEIIKVLKLLTLKSGATRYEIFNVLHNGMTIRPVEDDPDGDNVLVETKWMMYHIDKFNDNLRVPAQEASQRKEPVMKVNYKSLISAMEYVS